MKLKLKKIRTYIEVLNKIRSAKNTSRPYTVVEHKGKICLKIHGRVPLLLDTDDRYQLLMLVEKVEVIGYSNITAPALKILAEAVQAEIKTYE